MKRTPSIVLTVLLLGGAVAGCDPAAEPSAAASASASASVGQQALAVTQEWVTCLRDHGLTRMPDPVIGEDGYITFPVPPDGYEFKRDLQRHRSIETACRPIIDRLPPAANRRRDMTAEDIRKLTEFAQCVRTHGLPAFPDPNARGEFELAGTPLDTNRPGAQVDRALDACKSIWSGEVRMKSSDKGGGKK